MAKHALMHDREYLMNNFPREKYGHTQKWAPAISKNFAEDWEDDVVFAIEIKNPSAKFYTSIATVKVSEYDGKYNLKFVDMVDSILVPYEEDIIFVEKEDLEEIKFWRRITGEHTHRNVRQRIHTEILLATEWSVVNRQRPTNLLYKYGSYLPESMMEKYGRGL